ncbi:MAG: hypothetical protein R3C68_16565 [Myxococcota bacterium]
MNRTLKMVVQHFPCGSFPVGDVHNIPQVDCVLILNRNENIIPQLRD